MISDDRLRRMVGRAADLDARLSPAFEPVPGDASGAEAAARFAEWRRVAADDDETLLARRLEWDGLDRSAVLRAFGRLRLRDGEPLPSWTGILTLLDEALADGPATGARFLDPNHPEPFEELFAPLVAVASRRLEARLGGFPVHVGEQALATAERQLLHKVAYLCAQPMELEFSAYRARASSPFGTLLAQAGGEPSSRRLYNSFVEWMRDGGRLVAFLEEYAVLARLVGVTVDFWLDAWEELLLRLESDRHELARRFCSGGDPGPTTRFTVGLSDSHHGGRTVVVVEFASGERVVYKPKPVEVEAAYSDLLATLTRWGAPLPLRSLRIWQRGPYGWAEFVENDALPDEAAARRYYRRTGMLACLLYALRGNDAHFENIIASGEHPVLVDAETLMHPEIHSVGIEGREALFDASRLIWRSVVRTGLLPRWEFLEEERAVDTSAVGTTGEQVSPVDLPVWRDVNTDRMRLEFEAWTIAPQGNAPRIGEEVASPAAHAGDIVAGVREMYRFLLDRRADLLAPGGPLAPLRRIGLRFIYRGTWIYGFLLTRSLDPRYLRDGADRSVQLDALCRALLREEERPLFWPMTAVERAEMERMDIPCFTYGADGDGLEPAPGVRLDHCFLEPSFDALRRHVEALDEQDLERQAAFAEAALYTRNAVAAHLGEPNRGRVPGEGDASRAVGADEALAAAEGAAAELRRQAIGDPGDNVTWITVRLFARAQRYQLEPCAHNLYDGTGGIAVFLAALARVTGDAAHRDLALAALRLVRNHLERDDRAALAESTGIGGGTGAGSVVYSLATAAGLLEEAGLLDDARRAAAQITPARIEADRGLDVLGGAAGAILGLLALHERDGDDDDALERATACGDRLLAKAVDAPSGGRAWPLFQDKLLTGFSHGAAGIAYALERLHAATGDARFRAAAVDALAYERGVYSPEHRNWPDYRELPDADPPPRYLNAWCHGAPGIGLSRLGMLPTLDDPALSAEVEAAVDTTLVEPPHGADHACCGTMGRAELLLSAGLQLNRPELVEAARRFGHYVVSRQRARGSYALDPPDGVLVPGFFVGIGGIGYQLLRLWHPRELPAVLLWQ